MPKMAPISSTRPLFAGEKEPITISGRVKAARLAAMEKNMRYEVSEVRSS